MLLDYVILHRGHGVLGDELPGRVLEPLGTAGAEIVARARRSSSTSRCATSAASRRAAREPRRWRWSSPTSRCRRARSSLGLVLFFDLERDRRPDRPRAPRRRGATWSSRSALATVVFTGPGVGVGPGRRGGDRAPRARRLVAAAGAAVMVIYVGIAVVAVTALPVATARASVPRNCVEAPMLGVASAFDAALAARRVKYVIAAAAAATLIAGAQLGDARALAAGLLAGHQPPDPQRGRAPAPDALDALRGDRDRRGARRRPGCPRTSTSSSASSRSARCSG